MTYATKTYSAAEMSAFKQAWNSGNTARECAEQLSRMTGRRITRNAVIGLVHRHGKKLGLVEHDPVISLARVVREKPRRKRAAPKPKPVAKPAAPVKPPKPIEAKPKAPPVPTGKPVPFEALNDRRCKFAVTAKAPHLFCGADAVRGKSWCAHHALVVFDQTQRPETQPKRGTA